MGGERTIEGGSFVYPEMADLEAPGDSMETVGGESKQIDLGEKGGTAIENVQGRQGDGRGGL